jgi:hypothetical protein
MLHYTELAAQLKASGFNCGIYDNEETISTPRIYLNGYGDKVKAYLFVDEKRRANDFGNPITGYGLHVGLDEVLDARRKMLKRCRIKHIILLDLWKEGFALKPTDDFKAISL